MGQAAHAHNLYEPFILWFVRGKMLCIELSLIHFFTLITLFLFLACQMNNLAPLLAQVASEPVLTSVEGLSQFTLFINTHIIHYNYFLYH